MAGDSPSAEVDKVVISALNLQDRGKRLFREMTKQYPNLDPIQTELLVEACRIVDQLEILHDIIRGDVSAWAFVRMPKNASEFIIQIDDAVSARRQLQLALKTITATLTVAGEAAPAQNAGGVDDIADRARRRAQEQGRATAR